MEGLSENEAMDEFDDFVQFALPHDINEETTFKRGHQDLTSTTGQGHTPLPSNTYSGSENSSSHTHLPPPPSAKRRASFGGQTCNPHMFRPSSGREGPRDNALEFRQQYPHTKDLFKVFTQVRGHTNTPLIL